MKVKQYYDKIEVVTRLYQEENNLDIMLDVLQKDFRNLVDNIKIIQYFGINLNDDK